MCVYTCMCTCLSMYICILGVYACMCMHMWGICICLTCVCIQVPMCPYKCFYKHKCLCVYVCTCVMHVSICCVYLFMCDASLSVCVSKHVCECIHTLCLCICSPTCAGIQYTFYTMSCVFICMCAHVYVLYVCAWRRRRWPFEERSSQPVRSWENSVASSFLLGLLSNSHL